MFSLHGVVMVFLFIIPSIPAAMGNIILPIQLGAKDVAFPRLNLLSLYIYAFGACFGIYSMINGGVDTGWTFYTPYSSSDPAHGGVGSPSAVIPMTLAAFIMGFSSILTGVNFIATVHKMRAPGLTWRRLTLFTWALYATSIIQVLATPVLAITLLLLTMERFLGLGIFDPRLGGDPVLFQHFFWFYSHPAVYIMIVPGMGVVSEIIATFSRREPVGYMAIAASSLGLALLGFLVWGHHLFVAGMSEYATMVFSALTFLVAIPSGREDLQLDRDALQGLDLARSRRCSGRCRSSSSSRSAASRASSSACSRSTCTSTTRTSSWRTSTTSWSAAP